VFKRVAAFVVFFHSILLMAQQPAVNISFTVSMPAPSSHKFHVVMQCKGLKKEMIELKMPMWMPGYYQIMNYPDKLSQFTATDSTGERLAWNKSSANSWKVETGGTDELNVSYDILADRSFVATSYLDEEHGYLAPPGVFLYPAGMLNTKVTLKLELNPAWNAVATGLATVQDKRCTFMATDFDVLYDSPVLMGNLDSLPVFTVKGKPHYFVAFKPGEFDKATFIRDLQRIVAAAVEIIGDIPYPFYIFLGLGPGPGGIEHLNSACVSFSGKGLNTEGGKSGMYSFLAHEYFHHYNVKRIRPLELGPFDYDNGSKTKMLWLSEGITVYYEYIILKRAGLISQQQLLEIFSRSITAYENKPGRWFQTPAEASYETWNDGPFGATGERANKTISPYDKGPLLGLLLDFKIRHETKGRRSLDDLMRLLYKKYYQQLGRGFTEDEFRQEAEKLAGVSLTDFFDYIYTLKKVDYTTYLQYGGLQAAIKTHPNGDSVYTISPAPNTTKKASALFRHWLGE
jgi:predicted metalloprotease with PDZ domain